MTTVSHEVKEDENGRRLRVLCLHGFRTSAEIIKKQLTTKWSEYVRQRMDLVYVNGPFPCRGKSRVEGIFDPPYYEWFAYNEDFTEYEGFDECLAYIEDCMVQFGPFDGLLGFSQGGILSAALPGLQANGVALTKVPKIKFVVILGAGKFQKPSVAEKAYPAPAQCKSVHFIGDTDFLNPYSTVLVDEFVDPVVIRHPKGHTFPRFDEKGLKSMLGFLDRVMEDVEGVGSEQEMDATNTAG
ncbi:Folic acid and derivative biosynthetic process [Dorcoceras hygrometricum]|uniref:Folic acid and derivative biosynthetic process n=1 Tax=Dorcoceras hygrometricum TaxID=472368 RepID=A0A2Z7BYP3_9LAMI|nr:Folic acid and derivative biosynthetic process [Dorcoceras hygrometricum]